MNTNEELPFGVLGAAMTAFDNAGGVRLRYAPDWMRAAITAAFAAASAPAVGDVISFELVERICNTLSKLGVSVPESREEQAARVIGLIESLCDEAIESKQAPAVGGDGEVSAPAWPGYPDPSKIPAGWKAIDALSPATQGEVTLCFPGLGRAGPFKFEDGKLTLPAPTMNDLAYYFRQGYVLKTQGDARDTEFMDWLVSHDVEVRVPGVYGSRHLFHAQQVSEDDEDHRTDLREKIASAIAAQAGGE